MKSTLKLNALFGIVFGLVVLSVAGGVKAAERIRVILDTDANNEVDDQHALAYMIFNSHIFDIEGVTVNRTQAGGGIDNHYAEAVRVVQLCSASTDIKVYKGASGNYNEIKSNINSPNFDGKEAVDFIISRANANDSRPLWLIPVGKLTNIALALLKDPSISKKVKIMWLGSNWPSGGEYNLENDVTAVNPIIDTDVPFNLVTVRYGASTGADAVKINIDQVTQKMVGHGPKIATPVPGRNGGTFTRFGDYSYDLFKHTGSVRSLYDVVAVALVKNPAFGQGKEIGAPKLNGSNWEARDNNPRKVVFWENFDKAKLVDDFFNSVDQYHLPAYQKSTVGLKFSRLSQQKQDPNNLFQVQKYGESIWANRTFKINGQNGSIDFLNR